ncbi:hypothetical protein DVS28_b0209 (plasmid) [Euzebya pacifica]|uniref:Uncharacterized protein n=1 Tax=Euzebya pacifica TaxID=1608957 RepID=A0A346Y682_9ACTN|nr:hypothetical protein [Euzebya pacifica]AXV09979.1 hypothetical protein DVS28_b0209 [Euzebya pacifica]
MPRRTGPHGAGDDVPGSAPHDGPTKDTNWPKIDSKAIGRLGDAPVDVIANPSLATVEWAVGGDTARHGVPVVVLMGGNLLEADVDRPTRPEDFDDMAAR